MHLKAKFDKNQTLSATVFIDELLSTQGEISPSVSRIAPLNGPWRRSASCPNSQRSAKPRLCGGSALRANIRAAVWDKPRSDRTVGVARFMGSSHGLKKPRMGTVN
jgi:hypothetical protein